MLKEAREKRHSGDPLDRAIITKPPIAETARKDSFLWVACQLASTALTLSSSNEASSCQPIQYSLQKRLFSVDSPPQLRGIHPFLGSLCGQLNHCLDCQPIAVSFE